MDSGRGSSLAGTERHKLAGSRDPEKVASERGYILLRQMHLIS